MTSAWFDFISVSRILSFDVNKLIVNNENELICCLYEELIFVCCEMIGVRFDVSWSKILVIAIHCHNYTIYVWQSYVLC